MHSLSAQSVSPELPVRGPARPARGVSDNAYIMSSFKQVNYSFVARFCVMVLFRFPFVVDVEGLCLLLLS